MTNKFSRMIAQRTALKTKMYGTCGITQWWSLHKFINTF